MATEHPALPKPRTRLVRASKLPATFAIPTTWHQMAYASAMRVGSKVRVTCMGQ